METHKTFMGLKTFLDKQKPCRVFVHVSSPYSSGSTLRNFGDGIKESDYAWHVMFPWVLKYLRLGDLSGFQLPWNNKIWNYDLCRRTLKEAGHTCATQVKLCQTDVKGKNRLPVGKVLGFSSNSKTFVTRWNKHISQCSCMKHACFLDVAWNETAFYSPKLAKAIVANAQAAMCDV